MSTIANCLVEKHKDNFKNSCDSFLALIETFRKIHCYQFGLVSSVLHQLHGFMTYDFDTELTKQIELIPLLKLYIKISENCCVESTIESDVLISKLVPKARDLTLFKIMQRLNYEIKLDLVNGIFEDEETKLTAFHYIVWTFTEQPSSLFQLLERQSSSLVSLKLGCQTVLLPIYVKYF